MTDAERWATESGPFQVAPVPWSQGGWVVLTSLGRALTVAVDEDEARAVSDLLNRGVKTFRDEHRPTAPNVKE
jgi:hypothetical protein